MILFALQGVQKSFARGVGQQLTQLYVTASVLLIEAGAYYVMDRGYVDFERLYRIHIAQAFFITRAKDNFAFKRLYSAKAEKH